MSILVCLDDPVHAVELVLYGRKLAGALAAKWTVLYVERSHLSLFGEIQRDLISQALDKAAQLGGDTVTITMPQTGLGILNFAKQHGFTHIVTARSERFRWTNLLRPRSFQGALRRLCLINVHILPEIDAYRPLPIQDETDREWRPINLIQYAMSAVLVIVATGASAIFAPYMPFQTLALVYLVAVLFSAKQFGLIPSLLTVLLSANAYNYFFIPPLYSFDIDNPTDVFALIFFSIVAVVVSHLTTLNQRQAYRIAEQARRKDELYAFSRKIAGLATLEALLPVAAYRIGGLIGCNVVILMPTENGIEAACTYPPKEILNGSDLAAAQLTLQDGCATGRGTTKLPGVRRLFLPLQRPRGIVGVVGVDRQNSRILTPGERQLLDAIVDLTAVAIESILLVNDMTRIRLQSEVERLRNALLISISHDLRTPLSSVIGALINLRHYGASYTPTESESLLSVALDEAERLDRFVGNLLDMTKLEAGSFPMKLESTDLSEVISAALRHAGSLLAGREVIISIPADLPPVRADFTLLERVMFNLVDNAAKYTSSQTPIEIAADLDQSHVVVQVRDWGIGIPPDSREAIFDKFTRLEAEDRQRAGTGLGLAICRGFLEAMGGMITAANRLDGTGAIFTVRLDAEPHAATNGR